LTSPILTTLRQLALVGEGEGEEEGEGEVAASSLMRRRQLRCETCCGFVRSVGARLTTICGGTAAAEEVTTAPPDGTD
jgi:hypothetical protein